MKLANNIRKRERMAMKWHKIIKYNGNKEAELTGHVGKKVKNTNRRGPKKLHKIRKQL